MSDWFTPQSYAGESVAKSMAYRDVANGVAQNGPFYLYGYALPINNAKTLKSLKLPANRDVVVLAVTLTP